MVFAVGLAPTMILQVRSQLTFGAAFLLVGMAQLRRICSQGPAPDTSNGSRLASKTVEATPKHEIRE